MVRLLPFQFSKSDMLRSSFNPTMVRLLHENGNVSVSEVEGFNPTMVRLLLIPRMLEFKAQIKFQSHNGAIAADESGAEGLSETIVSIPQWCDCCRLRPSKSL